MILHSIDDFKEEAAVLCTDKDPDSEERLPAVNGGVGIECVNTSVISSGNDGTTVGGTPNLDVGGSCFNDLTTP